MRPSLRRYAIGKTSFTLANHGPRWLRVAAAVALLPGGLCAGPKIGVLLKGRSPFWGNMEKGALDASAQHGAEIVVKSPPSESDVSLQIQLLNGMATQGLAAVVIVPTNK